MSKKPKSKLKAKAKTTEKTKKKTKTKAKTKAKKKSKVRRKAKSGTQRRANGAGRTISAVTARARDAVAEASVAAFDPITQIAARSAIARHRWSNRGVAPIGYIKGMALVFARLLCKLRDGDAAATEMAKANTGNVQRDALAHYSARFADLGMRNDVAGAETLRHLCALMLGLGMRESSGKHCEGRDQSATNTTADTAEAGLFQTSFNARSANPSMPQLFAQYSANPSGFVDVFREGVRCSAASLENFGSGPGREFQRLSKECPAFAAEFCAVGLRNVRKHWGPITRREAELRPEADAMLMEVQRAVEASPELCAVVT